MDWNILLSPPVAFLLFIGISYLIFLFGGLIGAKPTEEAGKLETYACGEDFKPEKFSFGYDKFYISAIFFTIMHVAVLTIATVPGGVNAYKALFYLGTIAVSISILYTDFD